jgi:hypothetical protein
MPHRISNILTVGICLLLLTLASPSTGNDAVAGSAYEGLVDTGANAPITAATMPGSIMQSQANSTRSCLPRYGEHQFILRVNDTGPYEYEPFVTPADFNGDGLEDIVITKMTFQTTETYELDILLNDGNGSLVLATSGVFLGTVPAVQHPRQVVTADFNGDGLSDIFVADHGYDFDPFPGYQNTLVLTAPNGKLEDATDNLPQQDDFTHSACAADIDGDEDIDLYVGNTSGQNDIDPQILLNDGSGRFTVGENRLPPLVDLSQNNYPTCEFSDVNNDNAPDLILGDDGCDRANEEHSTRDSEVLLNDGTGVFTLLPNAMPPKGFSSFDIAHDIEPINLNDDAYVDLLIVYEGWEGPDEGWQGSYIQALVNNQDGTFRNETLSRLESLDRQVWIRSLELRDLDRDGALDLLAFPWDDQNPDPLLFLNDGSGHFSQEPLDFKLPYLYYTYLDLDGDSGHDIVFATHAPPEDIYAIRDLGCPVFLPFVCRNWSAES